MELIILGIVLLGVVSILNTNDEFYSHKYSNGITIVTNRKTGKRYMKYEGATNLIEIED